jgi:hypothetical protein
MKKPPNFPRIQALYALKKLSQGLNSDVLSDGSVAKRFEFNISRPVKLSDGTVMSQTDLFGAFRQGLAGETTTPLSDQDGKPITAQISFEADGSALVKTGEKGFRFVNAGLLTADVSKRLEYLDKYLARNTLAQIHAEKLRKLVSKSDFSDDDFLAAVATLSTSPESFGEALLRKVTTRQVALGEILPDDARHWDHLTAPIGGSDSFSGFIGNELAAERSFHLRGDPRKAMRSIALSFCAPGLVPIELFRTCDADALLQMLEEATQFPDHFGLIGAFEICGDWYGRDPRFGPLGERLLELLFSDMQRLKNSCTMYAAAFVLAIARLGQHQEWRRKAAFWRRLSGAAHASLVVRACGLTDIDVMALFSWAMGVCGKAYYMSVCFDSREEPRWRPDWIATNFLVADTVGRADAVLKRLPDGVLHPEWTKRIEKARNSIKEHNGELLASYPAIGESVRRQQPALKDLGVLAELYQSFIDNPTLDNFLLLGPVIYSFGIPSECVPPATKLIAALRRDSANFQDIKIEAALSLAAYMAMQFRFNDVALANAVAEFCIEKASTLTVDRTATEIMFRLIECAMADPDKQDGQRVLARRLENLAFVVSPDRLPEVYDSLKILQTIDGKMAQVLGRAIGTARLGIGGKAA